MQATCLLLLTFFYIYFFIYILCFSTLIQTQNIAQCTLRHSLQWHIHSESNVFLRKCTTLSKLDVLLGWVTVSCCNFCTACMVRDRERERGGGGETDRTLKCMYFPCLKHSTTRVKRLQHTVNNNCYHKKRTAPPQERGRIRAVPSFSHGTVKTCTRYLDLNPRNGFSSLAGIFMSLHAKRSFISV